MKDYPKALVIKRNGKEVAFDAVYTLGTITRLNKEAQTNREEAKQFKEKLALFGDLDPTSAKDALNKLKNLDDKKLVDAGEIEKLKAELEELNGDK